jgi:hypothetical protein
MPEPGDENGERLARLDGEHGMGNAGHLCRPIRSFR